MIDYLTVVIFKKKSNAANPQTIANCLAFNLPINRLFFQRFQMLISLTEMLISKP